MELELELSYANLYSSFLMSVSILVLMELELELNMWQTIIPNSIGFYPCFNGIRVGTIKYHLIQFQ